MPLDNDDEIPVNGFKKNKNSSYPKPIRLEDLIGSANKQDEEEHESLPPRPLPKKEKTILAGVYLRILMLFLVVVMVIWLVRTVLSSVINLILTVLTFFLNAKIRKNLKTSYQLIKRALITLFGCLVSLISPRIGLALLVAYLMTNAKDKDQDSFISLLRRHLYKFTKF